MSLDNFAVLLQKDYTALRKDMAAGLAQVREETKGCTSSSLEGGPATIMRPDWRAAYPVIVFEDIALDRLMPEMVETSKE
jgi:hypothetical protein